jgi:hypothetical protein
MNNPENFQPDIIESDEISQVPEAYKLYTGICDVYKPEEAREMADELRANRKNPFRKVMIGVMTHPIVLNSDLLVPKDVRREIESIFPAREEMASGFTEDPDVLNTIHYADLYGPDAGKDLLENLELCVKYGGDFLHAIQLDVTWPNPNELKEFRQKYPDTMIILQVGKFAMEKASNDPQEITKRLKEYGSSIDFVLLDLSMGKGVGMNAEVLLPLLRLIADEAPELGLAVAGGLGPESVDILEPIAKEFPDVSIDAQGNLKHKDAPRDSEGHLVSTHPADINRSREYIRKSCEILDNR